MSASWRPLRRALARADWAAIVPGWWPFCRSARAASIPLDRLEFVAIDTETTGLDPGRDAIVALAAIPFVGGHARPEAGYTSLVNPDRPIPPTAQATAITTV